MRNHCWTRETESEPSGDSFHFSLFLFQFMSFSVVIFCLSFSTFFATLLEGKRIRHAKEPDQLKGSVFVKEGEEL